MVHNQIFLDLNGTIAPFDGEIAFADYCVLVVADRTFYTHDDAMTPSKLILSVTDWQFLAPSNDAAQELAFSQRRKTGASLAQRAKLCSLFRNKQERLEYLREVCENSPSCKQALKMLANLCPDRGLFPGVLVLLGMVRNNPDVSVAIRTFGSDGEEVLPLLKAALGLPQTCFVPTRKMSRDPVEGGPILLDPLFDRDNLCQPSNIAEWLSYYRLVLVQDKWDEWNASKEGIHFAKPLILGQPDIRCVFFDDNVRDEYDSEDCERFNVVRPLRAEDGKPIPMKECLRDGSVVRVDRYRAMTEPSYFVDLLPFKN
jgi:hypothetical protein